MSARVRGERGFTVVEMLIAMALMAIVLVAFAQLLITSSHTSSKVEEQATLQNEVRAVVDRLTSDLREATNTNGTSPVESMSGTTLTFDAPDRATPFHLRRISYRLVAGELDRRDTFSTDTDGWPWAWPVNPGAWISELTSITSSSVFTYYDVTGAQTTDPNTVRSVRITLTVAPRQTQGGSATYSALVTIRALR